MPKTNWNFWNLIKFNEHQNPDGTIQWLMRKDQCMHCADPGCLAACPADGAIVKYSNGIVDFNQENCIGCEYCVSGCPFDIPRFNPMTKKVYKCTLCSDRVGQGLEPACIKACPTGCLKFGSKDDMKFIANERAHQLQRKFRLPERRRLRSVFGRRHSRHLRSARRDRPRTLRRPAEESDHPVELHGLEVALQAGARNVRALRIPRRACALRNRWSASAPAGTAGE